MKRYNQAIMAAMAIALVSSTPAWANESTPNVVKAPSQQQVTAPQTTQAPQEVKQALDQVMKLMPIFHELKLQNAELLEANEYEPARWVYSYTNQPDKPENNSTRENTYAMIEVLPKTGQILNVYIQNPDWSTEKLPTVEQAKTSADQFLKKLVGEEKLKEYQLDENVQYGGSGSGTTVDGVLQFINSGQAFVTYDRIVKGIPLKHHGFRLTVDGEGRVIHFQTNNYLENLDSSRFPDPSQALSLEEANKLYLQSAKKLQLFYNDQQPTKINMFHSELEEKKAVLVYRPSERFEINAVTGKPINDKDSLPVFQNQKITVQGKGKVLKASSRTDAEKLLQTEFGVKLDGLQFNEDKVKSHNGIITVNRHWVSETPIPVEGINEPALACYMTTNAQTGEVLSIGMQNSNKSESRDSITKDEALKKAVAYLEQYVAPVEQELILGRIYPNDPSEKSPDFQFEFFNQHQGIAIEGRSYSVSVDRQTGKVIGLGFSMKGNDRELPDSSKVVSKQEAAKEIVSKNPLQLVYLWTFVDGKKQQTPQLVYLSTIDNQWQGYSDATTGQFVIVPYDLTGQSK